MNHEESSFFSEPEHVAMNDGIDGVECIYESGSGAFCVYMARHLGRKIVLKALKPGRQDDVVALAQLRKEYALGFMVDSASVCRTLAWHKLPAGIGPAIEMEYCPGTSLRHLLDSGTLLSNEETTALIDDVLNALASIHDAGIVHRDIKPSNIIFDRQRLKAKVIDFGCADTADYDMLKGPAGTQLYTPPDKQSGVPTPMPSDDLYALGIIVGELATRVREGSYADKLRCFGSELCSGRYTSARQAAEHFGKLASARTSKLRSIVWCAIVAGIVIAALSFMLLKPRTAPDSGNAQSIGHAIAPAPSSEVDSALEKYTMEAGPLLAKYGTGLLTPQQEADAEVMRFADSLYRADMMYPLAGKTFTTDSLRTMAAEYALQYDTQLSRRFPDSPPGYEPERRRLILRGRILASLTVYHRRHQLQ